MDMKTWLPAAGHSSAGTDCTWRVVSDYQELLAMEDTWNRFFFETGADNPFVSHDWISTWWRSFGAGGQLHVVLIKRGSRLIGIVPLMFYRERRYGIPMRILGTLYNSHVPRTDLLMEACELPWVFETLGRHLHATRGRWDLLEFRPFRRDSRSLRALEDLARANGLLHAYWTQAYSPCLPVRCGWRDYMAGLSANRRSTLRRKLRRLSEGSEVTLETVARNGLEDALEDSFRIEDVSWKGQAGTSILADPNRCEFFTGLAERLSAKNGLRLFFLAVGGKRIAFQYCLQHDDKLFLLKCGYDPAYSQYSPSHLLTWRVLERAFATGIREYDFLGDGDDWKNKWASEAREHVWLFVMNRGPRGRLFHHLKFRLLPMLKTWQQKVVRPR